MTSSSQPQAIQWDCLLKEHGRGLLLFARQYCHCLSDAEDLVQEGMMRALKRFESAHATDDPVATMSPEHLVAYLYTCVRRASLDRIRSSKRRKIRESRFQELYESVAYFESNLEAQERQCEIEQALQSLQPDQRKVVVLKIWGGRTFNQIATTLDISINTAASRYRYGLEHLRNRFDEKKDHEIASTSSRRQWG